MTDRHARPTISFDGKPVARRAGFLLSTTLICPNGHEFKPFVYEDAITATCGAKLAPGRICNAQIYLLVLPSLGSRRRLIWAADVDRQDLDVIKHMTVTEALRYFQVTFPIGRIA